MANTIAIARGCDRTRTKETHRLGSARAEAEANTWKTFARLTMQADGSGHAIVTRNGQTLHDISWGPETRPDGAEQDAG